MASINRKYDMDKYTEDFRRYINENGLKIKFIMDKVGLNHTALYLKGKRMLRDRVYNKLKKIDFIDIDDYLVSETELLPLPDNAYKVLGTKYYHYRDKGGITKEQYKKYFKD